MTIDTSRFALACAVAIAALWVVCSLLFWLLPSAMTMATGHMLHMDMTAWTWHISFGGVLSGLILWSVVAAVTGALVAIVYNFLRRQA